MNFVVNNWNVTYPTTPPHIETLVVVARAAGNYLNEAAILFESGGRTVLNYSLASSTDVLFVQTFKAQYLIRPMDNGNNQYELQCYTYLPVSGGSGQPWFPVWTGTNPNAILTLQVASDGSVTFSEQPS